MAPPKLPRCCKTCGDTEPSHFYVKRPSQCKACYRNAQKLRMRAWHRVLKSETNTCKIQNYIEMRLRWGFEPPSLKEIAEVVGVCIPEILKHLQALEADGKIIRQPGKHRGLRLVE